MRPALLLFCFAGLHVFAQPSASDPRERYFREGEAALAAGRYEEAARAYEHLRKLDAGSAEVHARLGLIYFQQGQFTQAVPVLRQALKLKADLPNAGILLAMSLSELGRYAEALPGLEKGFSRPGDTPLKRMSGLQLQRTYTGLGRDNDAVRVSLELTRLYPDDAEVLYHSSRVFANYAYLTTRKLAEAAPNSVWRHQAAGEAYESQGNYDLAIVRYREVLALDPRRPGIHFRLGRVLLARAQGVDSQEEARKEFEQELQLDPTNANAAYELGEIERKAGRIGKAREYFEAAVKFYPEFEEALVGLGKVLIALGKPDAALPHLQKAIAMNPAGDVAYFQLSRAHQALGNAAGQQKALAEFRRLRSEKAREEIFSLRGVTRQEVDPEAAPRQ